MFQDNKPFIPISENIAILNIRKIKGTQAIQARLPEGAGGVYAWYKSFHNLTNEPSSKHEFHKNLQKELENKQFLPRKTHLPPQYGIELFSDPVLSDSKKALIEKNCQSDDFVNVLKEAFTFSIFMQTPLYVGKTNNFRTRVGDHLSGKSKLRQRLSQADIDIKKCLFLYITTKHNDDDHELAIEEVMSRLFTPSFTKRYG